MSTFIDCADNLACATLSGSNNINVNLQAGSPNKIVVSLSQSVVGLSKLEVTGNAIISDNSSNAALRITQTGAGEAIRVEDSANPDSTPFVVTTAGSVGIGTSNPGAELDLVGDGFINLDLRSAGASAGSYITLRRSQGTTASRTILTNGDYVGGYLFSGYDGAVYRDVAAIYGVVDGIPGSNDMPGAMIFSTTADLAGTTTERMRISSAGNVGIGTGTPSDKLDVNGGITLRGTRIYHSSSNYQAEFGPGAGIGTPTENYGVFAPAGKRLVLNTGDGSQIFLSGSNVGIGTNNPDAKLHVFGGSSNDSVPELRISGSNGHTSFYNSLQNNNYNSIVEEGDKAIIFTNGSADTGNFVIAPWASTTSGLRMTSAGNVGIGTSSPNNILHVYTTNNTNNGIKIDNSDITKQTTLALAVTGSNRWAFVKQQGPSHEFSFYDNSGSRDVITAYGGADNPIVLQPANGNVGIGVTSPSTKLHVNGDITANGITFGPAGSTGTPTGNTLYDYEEGTWAPLMAVGANTGWTYSNSGTYVKVGRLIHIKATFRVVTKGSTTGVFYFYSLPFGSDGTTNPGGFTITYTISLTGATATPTAKLTSGNLIFLYNVAGSILGDTSLVSGTEIHIAGTYIGV